MGGVEEQESERDDEADIPNDVFGVCLKLVHVAPFAESFGLNLSV